MASDVMDTAVEKGGQLLQDGREMTVNAASNVADTVKENPLMTLAAVAFVGVAIGALWRMKSRDTMYDRISRQIPRNLRDVDTSWIPNMRWR
jgi:hypothetical protein